MVRRVGPVGLAFHWIHLRTRILDPTLAAFAAEGHDQVVVPGTGDDSRCDKAGDTTPAAPLQWAGPRRMRGAGHPPGMREREATMRKCAGILLVLAGLTLAACPGNDPGNDDNGVAGDLGQDNPVPNDVAEASNPPELPEADTPAGTDEGASNCVTLPPGPAAAVRTGNQALQAMLEWMHGSYSTALWTGVLNGTYVARDGKTGANWNGGFCGGTDHGVNLLVSDSQAGQFVTGVCQPGRCALFTAFEMPEIDSDAAIQAAFPDDPAGTTYALGLSLMLDDHDYWTVTNATTGAYVNVDIHTGAVVP